MGVAAFVQYYVSGRGYHVTAYDADSQPVEEYTAGNHPLDSGAVVTSRSATRPVPRRTLMKWARDEARDTAKRLGLDPKTAVSYDNDGEAGEPA